MFITQKRFDLAIKKKMQNCSKTIVYQSHHKRKEAELCAGKLGEKIKMKTKLDTGNE